MMIFIGKPALSVAGLGDLLGFDAQAPQLAVKMRAFHAYRLGQLAHAAVRGLELVKQVVTFELLTRLAQRQIENPRGILRALGGAGRRGASQGLLDLLDIDLLAGAQDEQTLYQVFQLPDMPGQ
jgi:hypothetical protein